MPVTLAVPALLGVRGSEFPGTVRARSIIIRRWAPVVQYPELGPRARTAGCCAQFSNGEHGMGECELSDPVQVHFREVEENRQELLASFAEDTPRR